MSQAARKACGRACYTCKGPGVHANYEPHGLMLKASSLQLLLLLQILRFATLLKLLGARLRLENDVFYEKKPLGAQLAS